MSIFNKEQRIQIEIGKKEKLNIFIYADPKYNHAQMFELRVALENRMTLEQIKQFSNPIYNNLQMRELRLGVKHGLDISLYNDPSFPAELMYNIRKDLMGETDIPKYVIHGIS